MCDRCAELEHQIEELEFALRGAVWPQVWEITALRFALKITPQAARILVILSKTESGLSAWQLGAAVSESENGAAIVRAVLSRLYAKGFRSWVDGTRGRGGEIRLSPHGRREVRAILEAERAS